jgi:hypothetical protein
MPSHLVASLDSNEPTIANLILTVTIRVPRDSWGGLSAAGSR